MCEWAWGCQPPEPAREAGRVAGRLAGSSPGREGLKGPWLLRVCHLRCHASLTFSSWQLFLPRHCPAGLPQPPAVTAGLCPLPVCCPPQAGPWHPAPSPPAVWRSHPSLPRCRPLPRAEQQHVPAPSPGRTTLPQGHPRGVRLALYRAAGTPAVAHRLRTQKRGAESISWPGRPGRQPLLRLTPKKRPGKETPQKWNKWSWMAADSKLALTPDWMQMNRLPPPCLMRFK